MAYAYTWTWKCTYSKLIFMQQALALGFFFFRKPHYPKIEDEVKFAQMRKILLAAFQAYTRVYVYVSQWNSENIKFPQFFSNSMQRYFTQIKNVKAVTKIFIYVFIFFLHIHSMRWVNIYNNQMYAAYVFFSFIFYLEFEDVLKILPRLNYKAVLWR